MTKLVEGKGEGFNTMQVTNWRLLESELIAYFTREGTTIEQIGGIPHIVDDWNTICISLEHLAQTLSSRGVTVTISPISTKVDPQ